MPIGLAVTSIVTLFLSFAVLHVARDPKMWRLWWMDLLGVLDVDGEREQRKAQEGQMATVCYLMFVLLVATSLSCAFWTVDQVREQKRDKTRWEREIDLTRREMENMSQKPQQRSMFQGK